MENNFKNNIKLLSDKKNLERKLTGVLDTYSRNNSFENREFLCYLSAAIFLTYKKLYPQLNLHIPFRTKSDLSTIKNIQKEFSKWAESSDSADMLDILPMVKDMSGIRIVLDNINLSLPQTDESYELFNDEIVKNELNISRDNHHFLNRVDEYLQSPIKTGEQYYKLKMDLLKRIIDSTPKEFTDERKPLPSFEQLLKDTKYQYDYYFSDQDEGFPTTISSVESNDLMILANALRSRAYDKLHFAIIRKTLPIVLSSPMIQNALLTSCEYDKEVLKPNTFHAIYNNLDTPFGNIEVMAQSNKAYYDSTKGPAYHSGMDGKTINVKDFFELVDSNDEHTLSYYLNSLDNTSADSLISPYELPIFKNKEEEQEFLKTPKGTAYLESEKYREMMKHIKIKDKIEIGEVEPILMDTNDYLLSRALFSSPYMNVCSAGHTSFTNASIHHKKIIGEFSEVLRKKDSNTCLRDMLIRRLEELIDNHGKLATDDIDKPISLTMKENLQFVEQHDIDANNLPKDISFKNILAYAERLRNNFEKDHETNNEQDAR